MSTLLALTTSDAEFAIEYSVSTLLVEIKEDCKEDENHRSRRDHEIDRPNMHSFQRQTIGDCLVLGAGRGGFTHICVGRGSTAGRMSGELAPRAPPADCPGSGCGCRLQLRSPDIRVNSLVLLKRHYGCEPATPLEHRFKCCHPSCGCLQHFCF